MNIESTEEANAPQEDRDEWVPGGFRLTFHWRILGTPAPVFPGFEVDISDRIPDGEKPDAVWHRDRARGMLRDHPEIRELFTRSKTTALGRSSLKLSLTAGNGLIPSTGVADF